MIANATVGMTHTSVSICSIEVKNVFFFCTLLQIFACFQTLCLQAGALFTGSPADLEMLVHHLSGKL
jgi:hypothetical protein